LASLSHPATENIQAGLQATKTSNSMPAKDEQKPSVVTMREEARAPATPVVLNPGATKDQPKETAPAVTKSRATNAQHARRSTDYGADGGPTSRHQPTAYRSYKDLRNFTLNR
jgi:hypothetical protein